MGRWEEFIGNPKPIWARCAKRKKKQAKVKGTVCTPVGLGRTFTLENFLKLDRLGYYSFLCTVRV